MSVRTGDGARVDDPESADAAGPPLVADPLKSGPPRAARGPRRRRQVRTKRRLTGAAVVIVAAISFLLYKGLTSAIVYFKTANEAVAERAMLGNTTFQIEGVVVRGSVHKVGADAIAFSITSNGVSVGVVNSGEPPQLFQAGIPVVLAGHFAGGTDVFDSDQILVKHSNQYIAEYPNRVKVPVTEAPRSPPGTAR
jgi:cytochrome c-type biogenesis protein CcmE